MRAPPLIQVQHAVRRAVVYLPGNALVAACWPG